MFYNINLMKKIILIAALALSFSNCATSVQDVIGEAYNSDDH